jgi:hypothetical protein
MFVFFNAGDERTRVFCHQGREGRLGRGQRRVLHAAAGQQPLAHHQVRLRRIQHYRRLQTGILKVSKTTERIPPAPPPHTHFPLLLSCLVCCYDALQHTQFRKKRC